MVKWPTGLRFRLRKGKDCVLSDSYHNIVCFENTNWRIDWHNLVAVKSTNG